MITKRESDYVKSSTYPEVHDGEEEIEVKLLTDNLAKRAIDHFKKYDGSYLSIGEIVEIDDNLNGYDLPVLPLKATTDRNEPMHSLGIYAVKGFVPPHIDPEVGFSYILILRAHRAIIHAEGCKPLTVKPGMFIKVDINKPHRVEHGRNNILIWAAYDDPKKRNNYTQYAEPILRRFLDQWLMLIQKEKVDG